MKLSRRAVVTAALGVFLVAGLVAPQVASAHPLLTRGDRGPYVAMWQDRLNRWLVVARPESGVLAEDGIFGAKTEAATRDFQRARDIHVDGVVGRQTRGELREFLENRGVRARPVLSRGGRGPYVAVWQDRLNAWLQRERPEMGRLAADGIFGRRTEAATRDFQRARGIQVDGVVGPETRAELDEYFGR